MPKIQRARMMAPSGKPVVVPPVFPNAGVEVWYQAQLDKLVGEMYLDSRASLIPVLEATPAIIATADSGEQVKPTAAGVIIRAEGKVLVVERNDSKRFWGIPGGKIEPGETPEQAVRRETREETLYDLRAPLRYLCTHHYRGTIFATYVCDISASFVPSLNDEHFGYRWATLEDALRMRLHPGLAIALTEGSYTRYADDFAAAVAMDASPTKDLQRAIERWGKKWQTKFDLMSTKLSLEFSTKAQGVTDNAVRAAFKQAGFTVAFKTTRASTAAYQAVAAEQVGLIKSIAQKYHTDVATKVWESVKRGSDMKTLSQQLAKSYNVTRKRAALIARDQNAKAKAVMEAVRHQELGIKQAIWMHSKAGKEPRPTHQAMNNKLYDLDRGMWDSDEQRFVHPGELINCRCTMRPYIPGFETSAFPEWDIAQT